MLVAEDTSFSLEHVGPESCSASGSLSTDLYTYARLLIALIVQGVRADSPVRIIQL